MRSFGEQLAAVREDRRLTQEQIADMAHVTRAAVSSWERDRTQPAMETIRALGDLLNHDFMTDTELSGTPAEGVGEAAPTIGMDSVSAPQTSEAAPEAHVSRGKVSARAKTRWLIACAAVLVVVLAVALWVIPAQKNAKTVKNTVNREEYDVPPEEYFAEEVPNEEGKAYLGFKNTHSILTNDGKDMHMYTSEFVEQNGIGYSIQQVTVCAYSSKGHPRVQNVTGSYLAANGFTTDLPPYGSVPFSGGFPAEDFDRVGIIVKGVDANGEALVFHTYLDFRE